jgi:hypothetical protein
VYKFTAGVSRTLKIAPGHEETRRPIKSQSGGKRSFGTIPESLYSESRFNAREYFSKPFVWENWRKLSLEGPAPNLCIPGNSSAPVH